MCMIAFAGVFLLYHMWERFHKKNFPEMEGQFFWKFS